MNRLLLLLLSLLSGVRIPVSAATLLRSPRLARQLLSISSLLVAFIWTNTLHAQTSPVIGFTQIADATFYDAPSNNGLSPVTIGPVTISPFPSTLNFAFALFGTAQPGPDVPRNGAGFGLIPPMDSLTLNFSQPVAAFGATIQHSDAFPFFELFTGPVTIEVFSGAYGSGSLLGSITDTAGMSADFAEFRGLWSTTTNIRSAVIRCTPGGGFMIDGYAISLTPKPPSITHYVDLNSSSSIFPYTNWATAAQNIQDAIDASLPGDLVLVTNGVYSTGGRVVYGALTNRVAITKPITVQSVNGPTFTSIQGYQIPGTIIGDAAIRCVYVANSALLSGFTLTNGASRDWSYGNSREPNGGGAWCEPNGALSNCVIIANSAFTGGGVAYGILSDCALINNTGARYGGGAYGALLLNCTLTNNYAQYGGAVSGSILVGSRLLGNTAQENGGGAFGCIWGGCDGDNTVCTLDNCLLLTNTVGQYRGSGGGASGAFLNNCVLMGNFAGNDGGGASGSTLNHSTLIGNRTYNGGATSGSTLNYCNLIANSGYQFGGGVYFGTLNGCTIISNHSGFGGGVYVATANNCTIAGNDAFYTGGGASGSTLDNCIVYFNTAGTKDPNCGYYSDPFTNYPCYPNYSCTFPLPTNGICNITNDPAFINLLLGNFHLQTNSPCINSGLNSYAPGTTDLDGNPRIAGGTVDIGAYEFQSPSSLISYAWLQNFNLPTDGSADFIDTDGDHMNNWQEWRAGTDPTNPLSFLKMLQPTATNNPSAIVISWQSVSNRTYFLQRATNLNPPAIFSTIQGNILGLPNTMSCTDTNALGPGPFFYRVGVQ